MHHERGEHERWRRSGAQWLAVIVLAIAPILVIAPSGATAAPFELSYSGRFTDERGGPLLGPLDLELHFFSAPDGGEALLDHTIVLERVMPTLGIATFQIRLQAAEREQLFASGGDIYMEVQDRASGRRFPRQRFAAVPFALRVPVDGTTLTYDANGALTVGRLPTLALATGGDGATLLKGADGARATYTLPSAPEAGKFLTTDGDGVLAWAPVPGGNSGGGGISAVTAGRGLLGGGSAGEVRLEVDTGSGPRQIIQLDADGRLPAVSGASLTNLNAASLNTGTIPDARFPATLPAVSGASLTNLNAANLTSGTIPDARFPSTLPTSSGANLTSLNATSLSSGMIPDARFPATLPAVSGANLTNLDAANLTSGTIPDARFPTALPIMNGANLSNLNAASLNSGTIPDARFPATLPAASGANLTNLNAASLNNGTIPDARFPATLPTASGANLTNLNAASLNSGTIPDARFPATLPAASGANLINLNAASLNSGTIPDARFPATLPAASGANLTNLNATTLTSGTIPDARFPTALPPMSGASLTDLNATNLTSGTIPDARFPTTLPAASGANLTNINGSNLSSGLVAKQRGGTGQDNSGLTFPATGTVATDPTTAAGDLIYRGDSALQRLGAGGAGDVLTMGANAPAWSSPIAARFPRMLELFDEFVGGAANSASALGWSISALGSGAGVSPATSTPVAANHPGVFILSTGTAATGRTNINLGIGSVALGGGITSVQWLLYLPVVSSGSDTYTLWLGLGDSMTTTAPTDGVFFEYDSATSDNWRTRTRANNVDTSNTSAVVVAAASWIELRMDIDAAAASATFYVNDVLIGTHTTSIPTGVSRALGPFATIGKVSGTIARSVALDYFYMRQDFTAAR